jgi:hypothetical protein
MQIENLRQWWSRFCTLQALLLPFRYFDFDLDGRAFFDWP